MNKLRYLHAKFLFSLIVLCLSNAAFAQPVITSFTPATGSIGTLVTITGTELNNPTAFTIGNKGAIVISNDGTSLVGIVMPGATTGTISITTPGGTVTSVGSFTVIASPVTNTQQGSKLFGADYTGNSQQGISLSLSADGNTALVGGPGDNSYIGAVWFFTRTGNIWTQQGSKMVGTGYIGISQQGQSVSLSADGNTALVGGIGDNGYIGAAWIYTRIGNTWTQQGSKLVGTAYLGNSQQGYSVSLSADGNTALIGGHADNSSTGAVWIYARSGGIWTQQSNKLVGTGYISASQQGSSVSLSADGKTAFVGGIADDGGIGAAWVFTSNSSIWTQQGSKIVATDYVGNSNQGCSVSLSADGNTALVGGMNDDNGIGAAWIYIRIDSTWTQQGNKIVGTDSVGLSNQGNSVSLSADGNIALIGGWADNANIGAAWVFTRTGISWTQQGTKLVGTGYTIPAQQGYSVSISADGNTALIGGPNDNGFKGAAWVFVSPPATTLNTSAVNTTNCAGSAINVSYTETGAFNSGNTFTAQLSDETGSFASPVNIGALTSTASGTISAVIPINTAEGAAYRIRVVSTDPLITGTDNLNNITINATPAVTFMTTSICSGTGFAVTPLDITNGQVPAGTTYSWASPEVSGGITGGTSGTGLSNISGTLTNLTGASQTASYTVTPTVGTCTGSAFTLIVTVNPTPVITDTTATICSSGTFSVTPGNASNGVISGVTTYSWEVPAVTGGVTGGASGAGMPGISGTLSNPGITLQTATYIVTPMTFSCMGPSFTLTVTVNPMPATPLISNGSSVSLCTGSNVILSITAPGTYGAATFLWSSLETTSSINVTTPGSYTVNVTDANGCQSASSAASEVTENPLPATPSVSPDGPTSFCIGGSVNLTSDAGTTYLWSTAETTASINVSNTGSYSVQVTDANGCQSAASTPVFVTVNPLPIAPDISADDVISFCAGGNVNLFSSPGVSYLWSTSETTASINVTNSGSYTVQVTDANGCQSASSAATVVTVYELPATPSITPDGPTTFCSGGSVNLTSSVGTAYLWSTAETTASINVTSEANYTVQVTDANGCQSAVSSASVVNVSPEPAIAMMTSSVCSAAPFIITPVDVTNGVVPVGTTYNWGVPAVTGLLTGGVTGNSLPNINGTLFNSTNSAQTSTYTVTPSAAGCTGATFTTLVTVNPIPAITDMNILVSNSSGFTVTPVNVTDGVVPIGTTYSWGIPVVTGGLFGGTAGSGALSVTGTLTNPTATSQTATYSVTPATGSCTEPAFTVIVTVSSSPPPAISSFTPFSGSVGTLVTITGIELNNPITFTIGGVSAIIISNDSSTLVGMVMPGAITDNISVTTPGGTATSAGNFTVTASAQPTTQQGVKMVGTGNNGFSDQGYSVSLSSDGNTALVGGDRDDSFIGAAWIYTRSGSTWTQQGGKLVGTGNTGASQQGYSVSLSADGNTAIVGGPYDDGQIGAAWIYTRSGSNWTQQGNKLVGTGYTGTPYQGFSVSLSGDGNTALIGGLGDNNFIGGAWVFTRTGGIWSQQGSILVGTDYIGTPGQGCSVSVSADGNTAIIGGNSDNGNVGATWVFTRTGSIWTQQGSKLVGTGNTGTSSQGSSVAINANGNTAITGGTQDDSFIGAAWVFTRIDTTWSQQGSKLVGNDYTGASQQGKSVALNADGNTAIIGGHLDNSNNGAAWIYTRTGNTWTQKGSKLLGSGNAGSSTQGNSVALSSDGSTALVGGYSDNNYSGSVWVFTLLQAPAAIAPTNIFSTGFTANWNASIGTAGYNLDVDDNNDFSSPVVNNLDVANVTTKDVTGLFAGSVYYYRVKAYNANDTTGYSNVITLTTLQTQTIIIGALSSKTYGDAPFSLSATGGGSGNPVTFTSQDTTIAAASGTNGETITIINAGIDTIFVNQAGNANYSPANQVAQAFTIFAKPITITANPGQTKVFGSADQVITYNVTPALESGDSLLGALSRDTGEIAGSYAISLGTLNAGPNYAITYVPDSFVITAVPIVTSSVNLNNCPGNAITVPYSISGLYNAGNIFMAQLSDASGSFASPVNIGNLTSFAAGSINAVIPAGSASGTTYRIRVVSSDPAYTGTDNGSNITITTLPATPSITPDGPTFFCAGGSINLTSDAGTAYLWSSAETTTSINVTNSGSYTVQVTDANGCQSAASAALVVTVNAIPATPSISTDGPTTFCSGGSVNLTSDAGTAYLWSTAETTASINITNSGSYTVQVTDANGCQSAVSSATVVTINVLPANADPISGSTIVSQGQNSVIYTVPVIADASSYVWSLPSGATGASTTDSINVDFGPTAVSGNITVNGSNLCGNGASSSLAVTLTPLTNPTQNLSEFWGMTSSGGQSNAGLIFKTDGSGNNQTVQHSFVQIEGADPQYTNLIQASDGKLYGMTSAGGIYNKGVIFQYDPNNDTYAKKYDFDGGNGSYPYGSLMQASDGMLYGMASSGGQNNAGVIFQFDPVTSIHTKKIDLDGYNGGQPNGSLIQASDGMLYGVTYSGGVNSAGVIFQYNPSINTYLTKFEFDGGINGQGPNGSLLQASDGMLYGMTAGHGANNLGVLFQFDPVNSIYTKKLDFDGNNGGQPYGSLTEASDGMLYGMTSSGGANSYHGVLFQFDPVNSIYTKKLDFDGNNGSQPSGSLILSSDQKLYGMTPWGGLSGQGLIFQFDPITSSYSKVLDFTLQTNGYSALGSLMQASDGKLYGMARGGPNNLGVLFQFDPVSSTYAKKIDFGLAPNGNNPQGSLMLASDGKLYGMTHDGGINNLGVLFQIDPATSILSKMLDFDASTGSNPFGALIQASDGMLYGMTRDGGVNGVGVLFKFDPASSIFTKMLDFDVLNGSYPNGSLVQASDGKLYGMTQFGGANSKGVLFQFDPSTSVCTPKFDFDDNNGRYPYGSLLEASAGILYGMTSEGGATSEGVFFQFDLATSIYSKKLDFNSVNGAYPKGSLIQALDGKLYGMTPIGGPIGGGVLFQFDPTSSTFTKMFDFDSNVNGMIPFGSLIQGMDGKLYGTTEDGGVNDMGVMFQFDPITSAYSKTLDFNGANGANPMYSNLVEIAVDTFSTSPVVNSICAGSTLNVPYSIKNAFNAGNIFTAQLSDTTGSFASPVIIGSLTATGAGTINTVIPSLSAQGNSYRIRVVSSDPVKTASDNGSNITINELPITPTISAGGPLQFCTGDSVTLTSSAGTTYLWSEGSTTSSISPTISGSYTVQVTNAVGCQSAASAATVVIVDTLPVTPAIAAGGPVTFCAGGSVSLTSTAGITYLWSTGETTSGISPTSSGSYTVQVTNAAGCQSAASAATVVTIDALPVTPVITAVGPLTFCSGGSVSLTSSAGTTYLWSTGETTSGISQTSSGSYTVQVTNAAGCQSEASVATVVTLNALPVTPAVTAGGPLSFCAGGSVSLTSSVGTAYLWSTGETTSIISPTSSGSYTVQVTNAAGCQSASSVATVVTVDALPITPAITAGGPLTFCAGGSVSLTSSLGTTYLWSTGETTSSISPTISGSYTVQVTNGAGCQSAPSAATVVTIDALPVTPAITAGGPLTFCAGGSVILTSSAGTTYLWSTGETTSGISPTSSGSYTVQVTNAAGCQSASSAATVVTVDALPVTPDITAGGPVTFCAGGSVSLTSTAGTTYLWSTGETTSGISPTSSGSYTVQVTNAAGCQSAASAATIVTVNTLPNVTAGATASTLCAGSSTTLTGGGASTYAWTGGVTDGLSFVPALTNTFIVTGTDANSCTNTASLTITVNPLPASAGLISGTTAVCQGQLAVFFTVPVITNATSYIWTLPPGATGTSTINSIMVDFGISAVSGNISAKGINTCGIGASSNLAVIVNQKPAAPVIALDGSILNSNALLGNQWYDQNGLISGAVNQYYIAAANGNYYDYVTILGCSSDKSNTISKNSLCDAQFSYSGTGSVSFTDLSSGNPTGWSWNFGDGTSSSLQNPMHTYTKDGVYSVTLTIFNSQACMSTESHELTIGSITCQAGFEAIVNSSTGVTNFTSTSLNATGYYWDFGGGEYSINANPDHTFTKAGMYPVCLTITSTGCQSMVCKNIIYIPQGEKIIHADFSYFADPNSLTVTFSDLSSSNTTDWYWLMGDGMMLKTQNPVYTYPKPGVYTVYLGVTDKINLLADYKSMEIRVGAIPCEVNSDFSYFIDPVSRDVEFFSKATGSFTDYFWVFGDGTSSALENPVHNFSIPGYYHISLAVRNNTDNCMDEYSQNIQVGSVDCHAGFTYTVNPDNNSVNFTDASKGMIDLYYWEFGDGNNSVLENPDYTYKNTGIYNVGQIVFDNANACNDYTIQAVQVGEISCSAHFISYIDLSSHTAYFTNDILGESTALLWSFGDGKNSTEKNPINTFPGEGIYSTGLNTYDFNTGCGDYYQEMLVIGNFGIDCNADFVFRVDPVSSEVTFSNKSIGNILESEWSFGDETENSTEMSPAHTFANTGYYSVCLSVTNSNGIRNTGCKWVQVNANTDNDCRADFMFTIDPASLAVNFVDKSLGDINKYTWDFGDGKATSTSLDQNPTYIYGQDGFYLVKLVAENTTTGCVSNEYKLLNVGADQVLKAAFGYEAFEPNKKFAGYPVDLVSASSGDGATVEWDFGDKQIKKGAGNFIVMDSTSRIVTHYYMNPGKYEVCLRISDPVSGKSDVYCSFVYTKAVGVEEIKRNGLNLEVYPNPFIDHTTIDYTLPDAQFIEIAIFDQLGKRIETLVKSTQEPGFYQLTWETKTLTTGVYHLKLISVDGIITKQLIVTK